MAFWALIVMERNKSYILYVRRLWIMQFVEVQKIMQQADNIGWSQEISQDHSVAHRCHASHQCHQWSG